MTDPSPEQSRLPSGPPTAFDAGPRTGDVRAPAPAVPLSLAAPEMTRTVLALIALLGLIVGSLWVLRPFIPALIWATTIFVSASSSAFHSLGCRWKM